MSKDLPIPRQEDRSDGTAVVEWGGSEPAPAAGRFGRLLSGLGTDRRLPPLMAALGAVAAVASLFGEWLVMTLPNGGPEGNTSIRVPAGVSDVGGFGVGYLVGLLVLASAVGLALRGTPAVRPNARIAGLTLAGALLALLTATAATLDDTSQRTLFYSTEDGFRVEYGRGLVMAFVACALLAVALKLAPAAAAASPDAADEEPGEPAARGRRRRSGRVTEEDELPPPADLTVGPAIPFARPEPPI
ncbi:hypothetical protein Q3W71_28530 [Micromonospora sp. C28SCA-DRY-2]|uniref:hypothetical protein n=1 Tax=Micromonospora sp. C28SCA-DRY-2 TaxID=3059522 RepID=UPI0026745122|nr:hypothetical protein [Micromonospora sp. C28SCA-DRY-2]MDO3705622.1 hypothetical protein [Micromonospora sp. C28SCA-DRY-2]